MSADFYTEWFVVPFLVKPKIFVELNPTVPHHYGRKRDSVIEIGDELTVSNI